MVRNITIFTDKIKKYNFLDSVFIEVNGGEYELPFAIEPTKGQHSLESCESCRLYRELLIKELSEGFNEFPNCCEYHSNLTKLKIFNKEDFKDAPTLIADKIMYSYHHVINNLDNDDWYEDIIDYLEYNRVSFGRFPKEYGEPFKLNSYFTSLKHLLKNIENKIKSDTITSVEIKTRMNKVILLLEPVQASNSDSERDFNLLLRKYEEWYRIFPFDLPYFSQLKEKFKRTLPIYTGRTRYNKYLKTTEREIHTKDSFAMVLLRITKDIITSVNGLKLYEKGLISDAEKHRVELIISNRKIELYELSSMTNNSKSDYVKILKKWFKQEKAFIKELTPLLKNTKPINNNRPNRTDLAYYIYYIKETNELRLNAPFPSDKAWVEIGDLYNKNYKNIQMMYNAICNDKNERLKKSKIGNISFIIDNMLNEYPKALSLAKDELKLAELNS